MKLEYDIAVWFVYFFPATRIFDILIGCNLGYIYLFNKNKEIIFPSLKELLALILTVVSIFVASYLPSKIPLDVEISVIESTVWWNYSLIFLPSSILLVYLFACGQGKLSKMMTNNFTMYLARISPYGFLIHPVVYTYLDKLFNFTLGIEKAKLYINCYGGYIDLLIGIPLSFVACQIWILIINRFSNKQNI